MRRDVPDDLFRILILIQISTMTNMEQAKASPMVQTQFSETFRQFFQDPTTSMVLRKLGETTVGCYLGSLIVMGKAYGQLKNKEGYGMLGRFKYVLASSFFTQTSIVFGSKVLVDHYGKWHSGEYAEYEKGGVVGAVSSILSTPFKNISKASKQLSGQQKKRVGKFEALFKMVKNKGLGSIYRGKLITSTVSSSLFYSLYFGGYSTLNQLYSEDLFTYLVNPLGASSIAAVSSIVIGWVSAIRRNQVQGAAGASTAGSVFRLTRKEVALRFRALTTNWLLLSLFVVIQNTYDRKMEVLEGLEKEVRAAMKE